MTVVANDRPDLLDPDSDIIPLIANGDQRAFRKLVDRHTNTLLTHANYMLGDTFAAEDVTQTVFLKTWQHMPKWVPGQAKLLTWMRRVCTNICIDRLRKKKALLMDTPPDMMDTGPRQTDIISNQETFKLVHAALQRLPETQRAAISLSYYQHVSQKDGALILNVTESAYESLLVRARKNLKTFLNADRDSLSYKGADYG